MAPNAPLPERDAPDDSEIHPFLGVFPIAFVVGGLLTVARVWLEREAALGVGLDEAAALVRVQARAAAWMDLLAEGLIAGVVSSLVLTHAVASRKIGALLFALLVTLIAGGAFVIGFAESTYGSTPGLSPASVGIALAVTLLAYGLARLPFAGGLALTVGAAIGLVGPAGLALWARDATPGMPVRDVVLDLVAEPGVWTAVTERAGAPVTAGILTPSRDQRTDTGDKPAIVMTPPASVEFVVPGQGEGARLEAAAGLDDTLFQSAPGGADVIYRVLVDDEVAWETIYAHRPVPPGPEFDTTGQVWRHVEEDGLRGVTLRAGQVVRLETDWGELRPEAAKADAVRVGFGAPMIVRTGSRPREVANPSAPNIVYIVMDTQRRDRMGCYGYGRDTTPNLDALAARGLRFDDAYTTSSWTWPSTASLHTGLPPDAHGVRGASACTLSQRFVTLAEALQARGYTTAAFVGNPIVEPDRAFDQGFETFLVEKDSLRAAFRMSDEVVPRALEWMDRHAPLRFFLYLHLVDPHTPHRPHPAEVERLGMAPRPADWPERGLDGVRHDAPPTPQTRQYASDLYDASVATGDRWVGAVLDRLDELGLTDSTIVCFTSDHGEELFDHGDHGHGHEVWSELVRAPLILAGPGIPRDVRLGAVSNRYVPSTLARLAGAELPPFGEPVDLVEDACPDQALFSTTKGKWGTARYQTLYGLRRGLTVTHWRESQLDPVDVAASDLRRFDVLSDPGETEDLIAVTEADARGDVARMGELLEEAREARPPLVLGVGSGGRSTLEQIGYSDGDEGSR